MKKEKSEAQIPEAIEAFLVSMRKRGLVNLEECRAIQGAIEDQEVLQLLSPSFAIIFLRCFSHKNLVEHVERSIEKNSSHPVGCALLSAKTAIEFAGVSEKGIKIFHLLAWAYMLEANKKGPAKKSG